MKIIHVTNSLGYGGAEELLYNLITHYPDTHATHVVIYVHDGPFRKALESQGIQCIQSSFYLYRPIQALRKVFNLLNTLKPRLVHAISWKEIFICRFVCSWLTLPLVPVIHHNIATFSEFPWYLRLIERITLLWTRNTYYAVSPSAAEAFKTSIIKKAWSWPLLNKQIDIGILENGIELKSFAHTSSDRQTLRSLWNIPHDALVIGTVGRFIKRKRFDWLIERFAQVHKNNPTQPLYLVIVGDGDHMNQIKTLIAQHHLENNVILPGLQKPIAPWYSVFDIFVLTSESESFGIVTLEALAAGLPCLVTDSELPHHFITDGENGFALMSRDRNGFETRLTQLISDATLRAMLSKKAATCAQKYDITTVARNYAAVFNKECTSVNRKHLL